MAERKGARRREERDGVKIDCSAARERLSLADILGVSDSEVEVALEHAEKCLVCQVFLEEDRRVARLIREAVPRVRAPRELRERLYLALARERAGLAAERGLGSATWWDTRHQHALGRDVSSRELRRLASRIVVPFESL